MTRSGSTQNDAAAQHATSGIGAEYNPFSPEFSQCPYKFYGRSQREAPVCYNAQFDVWLVTGHAEVLAMLKNPGVFSSAHTLDKPVPLRPEVIAVLNEGVPELPGLLNRDPPSHTHARALFSTAFTPSRVAGMEPGIRALAHELVAGFVARGSANLLVDFSYPLPLRVIADLVGVPREDIPKIRVMHNDWQRLFLMLPLEEHIEAARGVVAYQRYYEALIADRRAKPRNDLCTALVQARLEDQPQFTDPEIISQLILLLSAGHETTTNLIGNAVLLLLSQHPQIWRDLKDNPSLIGPVIEETLRLESPLQMSPRSTTEAVELGGALIPKGARVFPMLAAANRDPSAVANAEHCDIHRPNPASHLSFGQGIHFCIGSSLARLEARIALETLREHLPNLRLAPGFVPEYAPNFFFRALKELPVQWDPPSAS